MEKVAIFAAALILVGTQPLHADDDAAKKLLENRRNLFTAVSGRKNNFLACYSRSLG